MLITIVRRAHKIAAYPPEAQRIIRAFQKYGVIHNDVGFADFGIEGAYDPRFDDPPDGVPYSDGSGRGVGQGLLVDLRFGVPGRPDTIIRNTDWQMIQLGYGAPA